MSSKIISVSLILVLIGVYGALTIYPSKGEPPYSPLRDLLDKYAQDTPDNMYTYTENLVELYPGYVPKGSPMKFERQPNHILDSVAALKTIGSPSNDTLSTPTVTIAPTVTTIPTTVINEINSCTVISSPGEYVLNENITNSSYNFCIGINSSDVILDGANHEMTGKWASNTFGVLAYNPAMPLTNITVKNLKVGKWHYGINYDNVTGGNISNNIVAAGVGIRFISSSSNTLSSNFAYFGFDGLILFNSNNNSVYNNTAIENEIGLLFVDSNSSNITDNWVENNSLAGIGLVNSSNNLFYNNFFNNTNNTIFAGIIYRNQWNTTMTAGVNIIGGMNLGGNYWANPMGTGFSETCIDINDGICDSAFTLPTLSNITNDSNIDYLPLSMQTPP